MVSEPPTPASAPEDRRLHPSALVFSFAKTIRSLILPAILALLSGNHSVWGIVFVVLFVISSVVAIVRYLTLTWRLDATELVVRQGVLHKSERHVPYVRIQNIDLMQNPLHRLFQVAEVKIETAGGNEPEAVLSVLSLADVEVLRARVFREREDAPASPDVADGEVQAPAMPVDQGEVLVRVPAWRLVFLGLLMNRGLAVIGAGFGFLYQFDGFQTLLERLGEHPWFQSLYDSGSLAGILSLAFLGLVLMLSLSIAWSLIRFWGFTLRAQGDDLQLTCGLFTRVSASIPRQRIQCLTITASWLHRIFGMASIGAQTAGGTGPKENANLARSRFVPVLPADDAPAVISAALPHIVMGAPDWQAISPKATRRLRRKSLFLLAPPAAALAVFVTPWTLFGSGTLLALIWWWAGAAVARARFARTPWGLLWRRGVVTQRTTFLPEDKVQSVRLTQSPFDRRHDHVTLWVDAAGDPNHSSELRIPYVDEAIARALFDELAVAAATTEYQVRVPLVEGEGSPEGSAA